MCLNKNLLLSLSVYTSPDLLKYAGPLGTKLCKATTWSSAHTFSEFSAEVVLGRRVHEAALWTLIFYPCFSACWHSSVCLVITHPYLHCFGTSLGVWIRCLCPVLYDWDQRNFDLLLSAISWCTVQDTDQTTLPKLSLLRCVVCYKPEDSVG